MNERGPSENLDFAAGPTTNADDVGKAIENPADFLDTNQYDNNNGKVDADGTQKG